MQNSEAAEPQEVPKNRPTLWAQTDRLIVSDRTPYVLLFLIQLVFFLLFLVCIDIFYILEE